MQSIHVYLLSTLSPPKCVIDDIQKTFVKFLWSSKEGGRATHWLAWGDICLPKNEGGLGFRSLFDVSKAQFAKLWQMFRTTNTFWSNYMWNQYCIRQRPQVIEWKGGSQILKAMLKAMDFFYQEIWQELREWHASVWYGNWTQLGALHYLMHISQDQSQLESAQELFNEDGWKTNVLITNFNNDICNHIFQFLRNITITKGRDKAWWMPLSDGKFKVSSAWE